MDLKSVGIFSNDTEQDLVIYLELTCEEIHLSPKDEIELFVDNNDIYFPMAICYGENSLQIYPNRDTPDTWQFLFQGKMYTAGYPSKLSELRE